MRSVASAGATVGRSDFSSAGRLALLVLFVAMMMIRWRRHAGGDGAEQMAALVLLATLLAVVPVAAEGRVAIAAVFIAAQASLSYVAAGIAKLVSPMWRSGVALPAILSTDGHGHPWAAAQLRRHPKLAFLASWTVIAFECLFPVLLLGPSWWRLSVLSVGLGFHVACAALMGLNSFLWMFPATYPCVLAAAAMVSLF